jgi:hypothetical protein
MRICPTPSVARTPYNVFSILTTPPILGRVALVAGFVAQLPKFFDSHFQITECSLCLSFHRRKTPCLPPPPSPSDPLSEEQKRARRISARLMGRDSMCAIAASENLSVRRVQQIVREQLDRRDANPADDFALLQIARLERANSSAARSDNRILHSGCHHPTIERGPPIPAAPSKSHSQEAAPILAAARERRLNSQAAGRRSDLARWAWASRWRGPPLSDG